MKIKNTTRTWYGKYAFKALLAEKSHGPVRDWLKNRGCQHVIRRYRHRCVMIFLENQDDMDQLVMKFAPSLKEQYRPVSATVEDFIKTNTHVEIRKQLLYKKFRHKVYFKYEWLSRGTPSMEEFVQKHLHGRNDYTYNVDWFMLNQSYQPAVYLAHDSDLMMLKMCVEPHNIVKITTIKLQTEL